MAKRFWTKARIAELRELWSAGQTAAAIGQALGGITRRRNCRWPALRRCGPSRLGANPECANSGSEVSPINRDAPLSERAAAAARAELRGERDTILGALGIATAAPLARSRDVPERWTFLFVMERMEEGFRILSRLPLPTRPKGYVNSMPIYLHDQADLNSQLETYELERMARLRNRVRILPSPAEIERLRELRRRVVENRKLQARRHADNAAALRELSQKLDRHAATVAAIRPAVAALEVSRSKLATWASIGFAAVVVLGWIVEGAIKWTVGAALSHFQ